MNNRRDTWNEELVRAVKEQQARIDILHEAISRMNREKHGLSLFLNQCLPYFLLLVVLLGVLAGLLLHRQIYYGFLSVAVLLLFSCKKGIDIYFRIEAMCDDLDKFLRNEGEK